VRGWLYDRLVVPLTREWYRAVLESLRHGSRLLDVGIGTAGALVANAPLVLTRGIEITGVDVDRDYLARAERHVRRAKLEGRVRLLHEPVERHRERSYDAVYFSASFMLLDDPVAALRHAAGLLAPGGRLFFTQTFERQRAPLMERIKPLLRRITTIDFGRVTYRPDFERALAEAGVEIERWDELSRAGGRSFVLVEGRPA
jgi:ubiquinone/menaquinone biosynthesis C-methylase UbiE